MSRSDPLFEVSAEHRRRTARQVRHATRTSLQSMSWDDEALDDAVLPEVRHDVGRKTSPAPRKVAAPERRTGFKVWKTPFWKRRRATWAAQNATARMLG